MTRQAAALRRAGMAADGCWWRAWAGWLVTCHRHGLPDHPACGHQHPSNANSLRDATGDPWDGRSAGVGDAPPHRPIFNFAVMPRCGGRGSLLEHQVRPRAEQARLSGRARTMKSHGDAPQQRPPASSAPSSPPWSASPSSGTSGGWRSLGLIGAYATFVGFAWRDRIRAG